MKSQHMTYVKAALLSVALISCKEEPKNTNTSGNQPINNTQHNEKVKEFVDIYGPVDPGHTWNMAAGSVVTVIHRYPGHRIGVYAQIANRWWMVGECISAEKEQEVWFDYPKGIERFKVVIDYQKAYDVEPTATIDTTIDPGVKVDESLWREVEPLSWIMAVETNLQPDYDFCDLVARVTKRGDGSVDVKMMALAESEKIWLHYKNSERDYVVTPHATDGAAIEAVFVDERTCSMMDAHRWFDDQYGIRPYGASVNVLDIFGANFREGATVTLTPEILGQELQINSLSVSTVRNGNGGQSYAHPAKGFYVSSLAYDIQKLPENYTPYQCIAVAWPIGQLPQVLVIPDVGSDDTATSYHGWRWPSKGSRIDMVYKHFTDWANDSQSAWASYPPDGWCDRAASKLADGEFEYWGYYPR